MAFSAFFNAGLWPGTTAIANSCFNSQQLGRVFAIRALGSRGGSIVCALLIGR